MRAKLFTIPEGRLADGELASSSTHPPAIWGEARKIIEKKTYRAFISRGHKSLAGFFPRQNFVIILSYPKTISLEEALEQTTNNYALTAAFHAASYAKKPTHTPNTFGYIAHSTFNIEIPECSTATEWINLSLEKRPPPLPTNPQARAKLLLEASQELWKPEVAAKCGQAIIKDQAEGNIPLHLLTFAQLAESYADLTFDRIIEYDGLKLKKELGEETWLQYVELHRARISKQALSFLTGRKFPVSNRNFIWFGDEIPLVDALLLDEENIPSATAWAKSLIKEAREKQEFIPSGGFVLTLPANYPLRTWALSALRIHADPAGLWVSTSPHRGENLFRWEPGQPMNSTQIPYQVAPLIDITLAALWRDMCVAGEEVVRGRQRGKKRKRKSREKESKILVLPRRQIIFDNDRRKWGTEEEQIGITKKTITAHWIKETFRKLPEGHKASQSAYQNAAEHGYGVIPEGYTFVKPHHRGGEPEEAPKTAKKVIAQGLQAATIFLNQHRN